MSVHSASGPMPTRFSDFPMEILILILDDVVISSRFYQALELRLVNKNFDRIIVESILHFRQDIKRLSKPLCTTAFYRRLCDGKLKHLDIIQYIEFLTDKVCELDDWNDRNEVYMCFSRAVISCLTTRDIFRQKSILSEQSDELSQNGQVVRSGAEILRQEKYVHHARALVRLISGTTVEELEKLVQPGEDSVANITTPYFGRFTSQALRHLPEDQIIYVLRCSKHWKCPKGSRSRRWAIDALEKAATRGYSRIVKEIIQQFGSHKVSCYWGATFKPGLCDILHVVQNSGIKGDISTIEILLDSTPEFSRYLACYLASSGHHESLLYVLSRCPPVDANNPWPQGSFRSLLGCGAVSGNIVMVRWILKAYTMSHEAILEAMLSAIAFGYHDVFTVLLDNLQERDLLQDNKAAVLVQYGELWYWLGSGGRLETIRGFLSRKPFKDLACVSKILKGAADRGDPEIMRIILEHKLPDEVVDGGMESLPVLIRGLLLKTGAIPYDKKNWQFPIAQGNVYVPKGFRVSTVDDGRGWRRSKGLPGAQYP